MPSFFLPSSSTYKCHDFSVTPGSVKLRTHPRRYPRQQRLIPEGTLGKVGPTRLGRDFYSITGRETELMYLTWTRMLPATVPNAVIKDQGEDWPQDGAPRETEGPSRRKDLRTEGLQLRKPERCILSPQIHLVTSSPPLWPSCKRDCQCHLCLFKPVGVIRLSPKS